MIKIGCDWCGASGWIKDDHFCGKCGRSDDLPYELKIKDLQKKEYSNWHTYHGKSAEKKGRKSKWEE